mmetsp:Transcript_94321/g.304584  ORF Transcript_94321/g.304584 Transcript_94321/m.304584 type:complete len:240 (-) Transcript_94321:914-1633(-)
MVLVRKNHDPLVPEIRCGDTDVILVQPEADDLHELLDTRGVRERPDADIAHIHDLPLQREDAVVNPPARNLLKRSKRHGLRRVAFGEDEGAVMALDPRICRILKLWGQMTAGQLPLQLLDGARIPLEHGVALHELSEASADHLFHKEGRQFHVETILGHWGLQPPFALRLEGRVLNQNFDDQLQVLPHVEWLDVQGLLCSGRLLDLGNGLRGQLGRDVIYVRALVTTDTVYEADRLELT